MNHYTVSISILFFYIFINHAVAKLIEMNPNIIAGFKWGDTPKERREDKKWISMLCKHIKKSSFIILSGGLFSIAIKNQTVYFVFLVCPPLIVAVHACWYRAKMMKNR